MMVFAPMAATQSSSRRRLTAMTVTISIPSWPARNGRPMSTPSCASAGSTTTCSRARRDRSPRIKASAHDSCAGEQIFRQVRSEPLAERELVADTGDELATQPRHQRIDRADVDLGLAVADDLDQIVAAERPAIRTDERGEKIELGTGCTERPQRRRVIGLRTSPPRPGTTTAPLPRVRCASGPACR